MEIELPPPSDVDLVAVPPGDDPPRYYPELARAFEKLGFARIGGLRLSFADPADLEDLITAQPAQIQADFRESSRTPETLLAAPDGTAFAGVDWFYRQPSVRVRTLLADGQLVETQRGWDHLPIASVEMEPFADRLRLRPEQDRRARGRLFTIVPGDSMDDLWANHRRAVARAGSTPVEHRTIEQAASLWRQALAHDEAIERNVAVVFVRLLRWTVLVSVPLVLALLLAGIWAWAADGGAGAAAPWLVAAAATCVAVAATWAVLATRLPWWLRYVVRVRPEFRGSY